RQPGKGAVFAITWPPTVSWDERLRLRFSFVRSDSLFPPFAPVPTAWFRFSAWSESPPPAREPYFRWSCDRRDGPRFRARPDARRRRPARPRRRETPYHP